MKFMVIFHEDGLQLVLNLTEIYFHPITYNYLLKISEFSWQTG